MFEMEFPKEKVTIDRPFQVGIVVYQLAKMLPLRNPHFDSILVAEQTLSKGAVESFHDRLVPVNLRPPTSNICFVLVHFFGDNAHE